MCEAKCRRPCLYTRSKSACRNRRWDLGNRWFADCGAGLFNVGFRRQASGTRLRSPDSGFPEAWDLTPEAALLSKSGLYGHSLAALGPAPGDDRAPLLGLHTRAKAVHLRAAAAVRLECTFRHGKVLRSCPQIKPRPSESWTGHPGIWWKESINDGSGNGKPGRGYECNKAREEPFQIRRLQRMYWNTMAAVNVRISSVWVSML